MIVQKKLTSDRTIISPVSSVDKSMALLRPHIDRLPLIFEKQNTYELISSNWFGNSKIVEMINDAKPDIVNVHWINKGFLSLHDLLKIEAPVVFTIHDSWIFTGGCHIPGDCCKYIDECKSCPKFQNKWSIFDPVWSNFKKKRLKFSDSKFQFVAVSRWMEAKIKESSILGNSPVLVIPNTLDCTIFRPTHKKFCRDLLGLNNDNRKVLCFGAMSATTDLNKGGDLLLAALRFLDPALYKIIVFGSSNSDYFSSVPHDIKYFDEIKDERLMAVIYNSADIFVMPSRLESFGQTASEAMACGTPVCAFSTSGLIDIVDHKINGYLATPFDPQDLARGIEWLSINKEKCDISNRCRNKAINKFSFDPVAQKYHELFLEIITS